VGLELVWAVMYLDNHRSAAVCRRIGMQLLGITRHWYHEPSLMFWTGNRPGQELSLGPEQPAPAELSEALTSVASTGRPQFASPCWQSAAASTTGS
jgi:hypothetical protein